MDRRGTESHMDWEYQNGGATDPTSPFAQAARKGQQSIFSTPSKLSSRPNPFAPPQSSFSPMRPVSPTKPLPAIPQSSAFAPSISARNTASPFRNPAFTTPRKPFDEQVFSEQEDSPAVQSEASFPNDTPEADRMGDVVMGGTNTPAKIDKTSRYGGGLVGVGAKKHAAGRGEIRPRRELAAGEVVRKRQKQNFDRDVGNVARRMQSEWDDSEIESDVSYVAPRRSRNKKDGKNRKEQSQEKRGVIGSLFHMLDQHPDAPDNLYRWIQLLVNFSLVSMFVWICYAIMDTVRSDIRYANEAARLELSGKMLECQNQYAMNGCAQNTAPALQVLCDEWKSCMEQDPEAIMRVKVTAKQIAEIINEFSETMNIKAWGFFASILILAAFANNFSHGRYNAGKVHNAPSMPPQPSASVDPSSMQPPGTPGFMWVPVQTPRHQRHAMLDDGGDTGTDSDAPASPPKMKMLPPYTPSGRRSPVKMDMRGRSPVKIRSAMKPY